jgi:hypothetical protein
MTFYVSLADYNLVKTVYSYGKTAETISIDYLLELDLVAAIIADDVIING